MKFEVLEEGRFRRELDQLAQRRAYVTSRTAIVGVGGSTILTDRLVIESRGRLVDALIRASVTQTFRRRHRRLRRHFRALSHARVRGGVGAQEPDDATLLRLLHTVRGARSRRDLSVARFRAAASGGAGPERRQPSRNPTSTSSHRSDTTCTRATPLTIAAAAYDRGTVASLLALGADVGARNRRGAEPLHYAVDGGPGSGRWNPDTQRGVIADLVAAGADPGAHDNDGVAPLHRAVRTRCTAAVEVLIELRRTVRGAASKRGSTPLHLAVHDAGRSDSGSDAAHDEQAWIITLLLAHGARPTDTDAKGKSVTDAARSDWIRALLDSELTGSRSPARRRAISWHASAAAAETLSDATCRASGSHQHVAALARRAARGRGLRRRARARAAGRRGRGRTAMRSPRSSSPTVQHPARARAFERGRDAADERDRQVLDRAGRGLRDDGRDARAAVARQRRCRSRPRSRPTRMTAPRLRGSVTPSSATRNASGAREQVVEIGGRAAARAVATTPWWHVACARAARSARARRPAARRRRARRSRRARRRRAPSSTRTPSRTGRRPARSSSSTARRPSTCSPPSSPSSRRLRARRPSDLAPDGAVRRVLEHDARARAARRGCGRPRPSPCGRGPSSRCVDERRRSRSSSSSARRRTARGRARRRSDAHGRDERAPRRRRGRRRARCSRRARSSEHDATAAGRVEVVVHRGAERRRVAGRRPSGSSARRARRSSVSRRSDAFSRVAELLRRRPPSGGGSASAARAGGTRAGRTGRARRRAS